MKNSLSALLLAGMVAFSLPTAQAEVTSAKQLPDGAQFAVDGGQLRIQFWSPETVRVTYAASASLPDLKSLSVVATPAAVAFTRQQQNGAYTLATARFKVRVDRRTGAVSFLDPSGQVLLRESAGSRQIAPATVAGDAVTSGSLSFELAAGEGIYGLGQHQQGTWNYLTGGPLRLAQANTEVGIPVMASSKGYMLLWDNPAVTTITPSPAEEASSGGRQLRWSSEYARAIDYYFSYGDGTLDASMRAYRHLTGEAPMMPRWMLGFWQCKERYASQAELLDVAEKYRQMQVPVDGIIQDWQYWPSGSDTWGSHKFDPVRYPDPAGMFSQLHRMHYHTLISVWAKFDLGSDNSRELNQAGGMFPEITRYVYPPGQGQWYDPFAEAGRRLYWKQIRDQLFDKGVDGWWLDAPEPEIDGMAFRGYKTPMGPGYTVYNAYPLMHSTGIYQGQRADNDRKRVVILTRSAYAGQQRNSAITWSGDIQATWQVFRNQIPAGLNFSLSGIPYWNTDTGGFFGNREAGNGDPKDPQYQELFARWFQFSAFAPMFRVHGSYGLNPGKEIYRFDDKTQAVMRTYLNLRYRLLPYLYSVAWQVSSNGGSFMRPLVMDFPGDAEARNLSTQYLFGPSILVTPVTRPGAATQAVYLPASGAPSASAPGWYNFWTGEKAQGGQTLQTPAPVETLPLFVRAGAILPLGPFLQYSSEKPADPIELRIYRGASGQLTFYEDEGDGYGYEKGAYATIPIRWNQSAGVLEIGARSGQFPGMLKDRTFHIVWVSDRHGNGVAVTEKPDAVIRYTGKPVRVPAPR